MTSKNIKHLAYKIFKNLNTNKCEFVLYETKTQEVFINHKSLYSSYDFSRPQTSRVCSDLFTDSSLLQHVPLDYSLQFTTAFLNQAQAQKDLVGVEDFSIHFKKEKQVKKKKKTISKLRAENDSADDEENDLETVDLINVKFSMKNIEDFALFITSSSIASIINLVKENVKNRDGVYEDMTESVILLKDKIMRDQNLNFKIKIESDPIILPSEIAGENRKVSEIQMNTFICVYIINQRTYKRNNYVVDCLDKFVDEINKFIQKKILNEKYLQGNNTKLVGAYRDCIEDKKQDFLSIDNTKLNVFNKFEYIRKLRPAINEEMTDKDKIYYEKEGTLGYLQLLSKTFSERKEEWDVVFEEEFPELKKYLQHLFNTNWKDFVIMLAFKYNFPWENIPCTFLFWGDQATGKSFLVDECLPLMLLRGGRGDTVSINKPSVDSGSKFNSYMENSLILFFDETNQSRYAELENTLKLLTTASSIAIENKGKDQKMVINKNWTFVSSNKEQVKKLVSDESDGRRYVCINTTKTLESVTGMCKKEGTRGPAIYKTITEKETLGIVALLSNKNVFNFEKGGSLESYYPTPNHFKNINELNKLKNVYTFIYLIPVFKMLLKQLKKSKDGLYEEARLENSTTINEEEQKVKIPCIMLEKKEKKTTSSKSYKDYNLGFNVKDDVNKVEFYRQYKEMFALVKGIPVIDLNRNNKFLPFDCFTKLRKNYFNQKQLDQLFNEINKNNRFVENQDMFLNYDEKRQVYKMYGESYNKIVDVIEKTLEYLEQYI
jgi:hypothetical protein